MSEKTSIEWTDHSWNGWLGCSEVPSHPGCGHCYAREFMAKRMKIVTWGPKGTRKRTSDANWKKPLVWNRKAEAAGERRKVFAFPDADVFEDWTGPIVDHYDTQLCVCTCGKICYYTGGCCERLPRPMTMDDLRRDLFSLIDQTPWLDWLLLTKRPENVWRMWGQTPTSQLCGLIAGCPIDGPKQRRPNVWLGCSVSDQATADAAIPHLLKCRDLAPVLFVSYEPALGPIMLRNYLPAHIGRSSQFLDGTNGPSLDWIIAGGESGRDARPCNVDWLRSTVEQCKAAGVPCFVKQLGSRPIVTTGPDGYMAQDQRRVLAFSVRDSKGGSPEEWPDDLRVREFPEPSGGGVWVTAPEST